MFYDAGGAGGGYNQVGGDGVAATSYGSGSGGGGGGPGPANPIAGGSGYGTGGDGGSGGVSYWTVSVNVNFNNGFSGGDGTNGQNGGTGGGGGGGGAGGYGIHGLSSISATLSGNGTVSGGDGGNGGGGNIGGVNFFFNYFAGNGGDGGAAAYFTAPSSLTNSTNLLGGNGGNGGFTNGSDTAGGNGGDGGAGVLAPAGLTLINSGSITGGNGGVGGDSVSFVRGSNGAGGAGVIGANMDITNSGAISGGLGGDGTTRADAITFTGGANTLTLASGWSLTGNLGVNGVGTTLTFKLDGIDANVSNAITGQGGVIVDVPGQVLTLSGTNTYSGGTTISGGTLRVASDAALGSSVKLTIGAPVSGVTDLSSTASALSSTISTYAAAPTAQNAADLASAQAAYDTALANGRSAGTVPTLELTGPTVLDGGTDGRLVITAGQAAAIRLDGTGAGLEMTNYNAQEGGAIFVDTGGVLDLSRSSSDASGFAFSGNSASAGGGAIFNKNGTVSLAGATFIGNSAQYVGGAITSGGTLVIADSAFSGNSATTGGAIFAADSVLVKGSVFAENNAWQNGGAIYLNHANTSIVDSTFTANTAGLKGGAIYNNGGTLNLSVSGGSTSLFSGNTAAGAASSIYLAELRIDAANPQLPPTYYPSSLTVVTASNGLLDMRDPMGGSSKATTQTITKSGAGTWALGGANVFASTGAAGATSFTVSEGTLYLYGAGEVTNPTASDPLAVVGAGSLQLGGSGSSFTLGSGASLVAGGANSISTDGTITFEDGATVRGGSAGQALGGADPTRMESGGATSLKLTATGGITLAGNLNVAALAAGDTFTLDGDLGGANGALTKTGAGTVVLKGASTYAGATHVSAGTLRSGAQDSFSAASAHTVDAGATLDLGGFDNAVGSLAGAGSVTNSGTADAVLTTGGNNTSTTFSGIISDGATNTTGLTKTGTGVMTLTGANTYSGGTRIDGGTLSVSSGANLGDVAGNLIFNGGTLATTASFDTARDVTVLANSGIDVAAGTTLGLSGGITGTGALAKQGTGTLALSGTSAVDWNVEAGRLSADAAGFSGAVAISGGAQFALSASNTATYTGVLTGTGTFVKEGAGTLTYSGDGSAFIGLTEVTEGRLAVNGALGGQVDVSSGASLGGTGTVGVLNVSAGGHVGPGNSIGTLSVAGDATFEAGSVYDVEIAGSGAGDLLAVGGTAYLNGGTVEVTALDPKASYQTGQTYTILTAQNGVVGSFDGVESTTPFLRTELDQSADAVNLTIAVMYNFTTVATTPNQFATASALDTLPQSGAPLQLYNALLFLPTAGAARAAFDLLSGEAHASAQSLSVEQSSLVRNAVTDRLRAAQGGVGAGTGPVVSYAPEAGPGATPAGRAIADHAPLTATAAPATTQGPALWATGFGAWDQMNGSANAASLSGSSGGFLIGADTSVAGGWRIGVAGGYSYSDFAVGARASSGSSDNWHVAAYGGNSWGALSLRTGLAYTWQDITTSRTVAFPGYVDQLNADYGAGLFQAFGDVGYRLDAGLAALEPYADLAYVSLDTGSYVERGGAAALHSDGSSMGTGFTTLGLRLETHLLLATVDTTVRGAVGWRHAFGDVTPEVTQAFLGSIPFTVAGLPVATDAAVLEGGLDMHLSRMVKLGLSYAGQFGDGVSQNSVNATLRASF